MNVLVIAVLVFIRLIFFSSSNIFFSYFVHLQNDRDVGNVENFGTMFMMATSFNGDLSKWRVNKATTMNQMFYESYFVGNLHKWYEENID